MDSNFPEIIKKLKAFDGRFEAFKSEGPDFDTYFASYPAGAKIDSHNHESENVGIVIKGELILFLGGQETLYSLGEWYHLPAKQDHAARFEVDTEIIEFWFKH